MSWPSLLRVQRNPLTAATTMNTPCGVAILVAPYTVDGSYGDLSATVRRLKIPISDAHIEVGK